MEIKVQLLIRISNYNHFLLRNTSEKAEIIGTFFSFKLKKTISLSYQNVG